jgi:hypothetical protein
MFCSKCGIKLKIEDNFCYNCGNQINSNDKHEDVSLEKPSSDLNCKALADEEFLNQDLSEITSASEEEVVEDSEQKLVFVINKNSKSDIGVFADIQQDVTDYIGDGMEMSFIRQMAIAYTLRTSAAGLFIQGVYNQEDYNVMKDFWLDTVKKTDHPNSKVFQTEAANQSFELIKSYDKRLTNTLISSIISPVNNGSLVSVADMGIQISLDEAISFFENNNLNEEDIGQQTFHIDNNTHTKDEAEQLGDIVKEILKIIQEEGMQEALLTRDATGQVPISDYIRVNKMDGLVSEACDIMNVTPDELFQRLDNILKKAT